MKDIFKKIANLVVEVPEDPTPSSAPSPAASAAAWDSEPKVRKTIADLVRDAPGPNLEDVHVAVPTPAHASTEGAPAPSASGPLFGEDGKVDVNAIYAKANLPSSPFTAEQAHEMIQGLPADLPVEMKKQTVRVMLSAMGKTLGVTPETIVTDAARKVAALHSFVDGMTRQSEAYVAKVENDIRDLESQIASSRESIKMAQKRVTDLQASCEFQASHLNEAAEFFSTGGPSGTQTQQLPPV